MTDADEQPADPKRLEARIVELLKLGPARNTSLARALGYSEVSGRELDRALQSLKRRGAVRYERPVWRLV